MGKGYPPRPTRAVPVQELRKVQQTNKRTLIISLPKRWGTAFPVGPGDHIQMELQADGTVILRPHAAASAARPAVIPAAHGDMGRVMDDVATRFLQGAAGLAVEGLSLWPRPLLDALRADLRDRFGAEIVDEGTDAIEARFLGADRPEQLEIAGRRLLRLIGEALRGMPVDLVVVDRCRLLAMRHLMQASGESARNLRIGPVVLHLAALASLVPVGDGSGEAWSEALLLAGAAALSGGKVQAPELHTHVPSDAWAAAAIHSLAPLAGRGGPEPTAVSQ